MGLQGSMLTKKACGNCLFCVKSEGEPYYCAVKDLYHFVEEDNSGCEDWRLDYNARIDQFPEMVD